MGDEGEPRALERSALMTREPEAAHRQSPSEQSSCDAIGWIRRGRYVIGLYIVKSAVNQGVNGVECMVTAYAVLRYNKQAPRLCIFLNSVAYFDIVLHTEGASGQQQKHFADISRDYFLSRALRSCGPAAVERVVDDMAHNLVKKATLDKFNGAGAVRYGLRLLVF